MNQLLTSTQRELSFPGICWRSVSSRLNLRPWSVFTADAPTAPSPKLYKLEVQLAPQGEHVGDKEYD